MNLTIYLNRRVFVMSLDTIEYMDVLQRLLSPRIALRRLVQIFTVLKFPEDTFSFDAAQLVAAICDSACQYFSLLRLKWTTGLERSFTNWAQLFKTQ